MSRIEPTEPRPPSIPLNLASFFAPTLAFFVEVAVYGRVGTSIWGYFVYFMLAQWVLGFIIGVVLAYRAPTPRLRCAAKWYVFGTLLLSVVAYH